MRSSPIKNEMGCISYQHTPRRISWLTMCNVKSVTKSKKYKKSKTMETIVRTVEDKPSEQTKENV